MTIGLVTDSTAYLSAAEIELHNIEVIPVQVVIDGKSYAEHSEITVTDLISALRSKKSVTTSRPTSLSFSAAYQKLADSGVTEILSVHLSKELSGTYESALLAAKKSSVPVQVIDSKGVAGFLGLAVKLAAKMIKAGYESEEIASVINEQCAETKMYFYVDTLEFLERGGRISLVKSKLGGLLTLKPILKMENGRVEPFEVVRTETKALTRLVELATEGGSDNLFEINHLACLDRAEQLAEAIADQLKINPIEITETGAVVATHVGPGAVAVAIAPNIAIHNQHK